MNLVDLAVLVLHYRSHMDAGSSLPLPLSCSLASGSQIQSIVTCSGFLEPGNYAILPLAFNHWDLNCTPASPRLCGGSQTLTAGCKPYWVALHSSKQVQYQKEAKTRPGFLAESIFLLSSRARATSSVSVHVCLHACHVSMPVYLAAFPRDVSPGGVSEACMSYPVCSERGPTLPLHRDL